jgi:hypothetical protein
MLVEIEMNQEQETHQAQTVQTFLAQLQFLSPLAQEMAESK